MSSEYRPPRLVLTPRAWLKWQFLCHAGPTEIGAFSLSQERSPLVVEDLLVVKQVTTITSVAFDDGAVADLFDAMADRGIPPRCFARIWLHTHPGASVTSGCASGCRHQAEVQYSSYSSEFARARNSTKGPTWLARQRAPVLLIRKFTSSLMVPSTKPLPMLWPRFRRKA